MSSQWERACALSELRPGKTRSVVVHGYGIALYNVGGKIYATQDACPHEGVSLGCGGHLKGHTIACGYHHWEFDVRTGVSTDGFDDVLVTFPVRVDGGAVWVGLPEGLEPVPEPP